MTNQIGFGDNTVGTKIPLVTHSIGNILNNI